MVIPEYQDGKSEDALTMLKKAKAISSRQAGGQASTSIESEVITPRIIVDMREFRSDLPCLIHRRGIEVVPLTITIGDYILTPDICVERKSIPDLVGSLGSGRLYTQCIQMTRFYSKPILLIEFDQNKPFHLQVSVFLVSLYFKEINFFFNFTEKFQFVNGLNYQQSRHCSKAATSHHSFSQTENRLVTEPLCNCSIV